MGTELDVYRSGTLDERLRYARIMAASRLLPSSLRGGDPDAVAANTLMVMETGAMLNIHPIAALQGVHIIEGKPSLSAQLMSAKVHQAGHKLRVVTSGDVVTNAQGKLDPAKTTFKAVATLIRSDDEKHPFVVTWDYKRAERAKVLGKDNWVKYFEAMIKARAISEVAREGAPDALMGVIYTPEELGATVDEQGEPIVLTQRTDDPGEQPQPDRQVRPETTPDIADAATPQQKRDEFLARADKLTGDVEGIRALYKEVQRAGGLGWPIEDGGDPDTPTLHDYLVKLGEAAAAAAEAATANPDTGEIVDAEIVDDEDTPAVLDESLAEASAKPATRSRTRKPANAAEPGAEQG